MKVRSISEHMKENGYKTFFTDFVLLEKKALEEGLKDKDFREKLETRFGATENQGLLYVLYRGDQPFYIGKASKDGWKRIKSHIKNKIAWDSVMLLQTKKRYLSALEGLLISVARPSDNDRQEKIIVNG